MTSEIGQQVILSAQKLNVYYGEFNAVKDVDIDINQNSITALIGPSGCGKTTFLRCLNRMNDLIVGASVQGKVMFEGVDLYGGEIDATEIRSRIGMVFQKPNPFPKSIYQNIACLKVNGFKGNYDEAVERALNEPHFGMKLKTG